jgi:hypothetical protein
MMLHNGTEPLPEDPEMPRPRAVTVTDLQIIAHDARVAVATAAHLLDRTDAPELLHDAREQLRIALERLAEILDAPDPDAN